jgi:type II secretion system protein H
MIRREKGFTLLEIVVVVLILSILTAVIVPRWASAVNQCYLDNAAKRIAADLAKAQSLAYATSKSQTVTFTPTANRYTIDGMADLDHPSSTYTVYLDRHPYQSSLYSVDLPGAQPVTFNGYGQPVGLPSGGGKIVISSGNLTHTITIDPATGTATIQ